MARPANGDDSAGRIDSPVNRGSDRWHRPSWLGLPQAAPILQPSAGHATVLRKGGPCLGQPGAGPTNPSSLLRFILSFLHDGHEAEPGIRARQAHCFGEKQDIAMTYYSIIVAHFVAN